MNILFLTHSKLDWLCDYVFQGLIQSGHNVFHYPPKPAYNSEVNDGNHLNDHQAIVKSCHADTLVTRKYVKEQLVKNKFDLIVCTPKSYATRGRFLSDAWRHLRHEVISPRKDIGWRHLLRLPVPKHSRIAVIDGRDLDKLSRDDVELLERADIFFKREIPLETPQILRDLPDQLKKNAYSQLDKLRPVSFGINLSRFRKFYPEQFEKKYDIAFLMNPANHPLRQRVFQALQEMRKEFNIYLSDGGARNGLSISEYYQVIKQSRLAVSVSGRGWDCLRHYEIVACGSVLMLNEPDIHTNNFFTPDNGALFFKSDMSDFAGKLRSLLNEPHKISKFTTTAIKHLERFFDVKATADYIISEVSALQK